MITGKRTRRWVAFGVALMTAPGAGGAWSRHDPLPVRAVIRRQGGSWEQGFAPDGRSYLIQVRGTISPATSPRGPER